MAHLHKMIDKNIDKSSSDISLERQKNMPYSHKENNDIIQNLNIYQDKSLPCEKYNDEYTLVRTMDASNGSIKNGNSYDKLYEDVYMIDHPYNNNFYSYFEYYYYYYCYHIFYTCHYYPYK